jgi:thiamine biosynthesis lipoprotein
MPTDAAIAAAHRHVGFDKLRLIPPDRASFVSPGSAIDLGGIGKGYAVDRVIDRLREIGVTAGFVSFGESSIRGLGSPEGERGWEVWIRRERGAIGPVRLRDAALSTSRSLARGRRIGDVQIGDIIDPRSGRPVARDCQATVRAASATDAEAWSKALLIDADRTFRAFEAEPTLAGFLVCSDAVRASPPFTDLLPR